MVTIVQDPSAYGTYLLPSQETHKISLSYGIRFKWFVSGIDGTALDLDTYELNYVLATPHTFNIQFWNRDRINQLKQLYPTRKKLKKQRSHWSIASLKFCQVPLQRGCYILWLGPGSAPGSLSPRYCYTWVFTLLSDRLPFSTLVFLMNTGEYALLGQLGWFLSLLPTCKILGARDLYISQT